MKDDFKRQMAEAIKLRENGRLESAREILANLAARPEAPVPILAGYGDVLWELGELDAAVIVFRRATQLEPTLEAVSLGLFHTLWKLNRRDEAMEEIKRFQSVANSEDYRKIVNEIIQKL